MDWVYLVLFESILIFATALLGTYLLWIYRKKKQPFGYLFTKYGYGIGWIVAIGAGVALALIFGE